MISNIDFSKVGKRIRSARKLRNMTQEELALACGCTSNHLSAVETCDHRPSLDLIVRIATTLDSSIDHFLIIVPQGMRSEPYTGQTALQRRRTHAAHRPSGH